MLEEFIDGIFHVCLAGASLLEDDFSWPVSDFLLPHFGQNSEVNGVTTLHLEHAL